MRSFSLLLVCLLTGCDSMVSAFIGREYDTSVCTLSVEVPADSCTCSEGVAWTATDVAGDAYSSEYDGAPGVQPPGETQDRTIAPGAFALSAVWYYADGDTSEAEATGVCQGGGYATFHLSCDCDAAPIDTADTGIAPDTGA